MKPPKVKPPKVKPPKVKPNSSLKKKFVKGAVLGAGAYVGYKAAKMVGKFATSALSREGYDLDEWNNWRRADGMLCQNTDDCRWINHKCTARVLRSKWI